MFNSKEIKQLRNDLNIALLQIEENKIKIKQLECPHDVDNTRLVDRWNSSSVVCRNCEKVLQKDLTSNDLFEFEKLKYENAKEKLKKQKIEIEKECIEINKRRFLK